MKSGPPLPSCPRSPVLGTWPSGGGQSHLEHYVDPGRAFLEDSMCGLIILERLIPPLPTPVLHLSLPLHLGRLAVNLHFNHFSRRGKQTGDIWWNRPPCTRACGIVPRALQDASRSSPSSQGPSTAQENRILGSLAICYSENVFPSQGLLLFLTARIIIKIQIVCYLKCL